MSKQIIKFKHYSISKINSFGYCAHQAAHGYVLGMWNKRPSPSLIAGKAIENAVNQGIIEWKMNKREITRDEILEIIINSFQIEYTEKEKQMISMEDEIEDFFNIEFPSWDEEEREKVEGIIFYDIKTDKFPLIDLLIEKVIPDLRNRVDKLQEEFHINIAGERLKCIIDYTAEKNVLIDLKTTAKTWAKDKEMANDQAYSYPMFLFKKHPELNKVIFEFHIIVLLVKPKYEVRTIEITRNQCFSFLEYLNSKIQNINGMLEKYNENNRLQIFPGNRESWFCSRKKCHVWESCEKNFNWRIKE